MLRGDQQQGARSTGRRAAPLLPVLQRADGDAEQSRELLLRETSAFADCGDGRNRRDTTGLAALEFPQPLEDLGAKLSRASHPSPL